ncbi:MAG: dihydroxyacetone kinase subunit L [Sphaerochaeta sp.]|nr:dihydroxyacetone kinase subunit L [Sphaerochaeta sp.]MDD3930194.1 dihydroxyacetone kinase subunit L [Sphaerochaeta sp.]
MIVQDFLASASALMTENRDRLIDLDSVVGDGDLGLTMSDGFKAAYESVRESGEADVGKLFYAAGKAMSIAVPSTMGTLMASGLMQVGKTFKGKTEVQTSEYAALFQAYFDGVSARGKAKVGEKTFLDGLFPAIGAMQEAIEAGRTAAQVAQAAAEAARKGYESTQGMIAVHGRAATRGESSRQLLDPGAAVAALLMEAFAQSVS